MRSATTRSATRASAMTSPAVAISDSATTGSASDASRKAAKTSRVAKAATPAATAWAMASAATWAMPRPRPASVMGGFFRKCANQGIGLLGQSAQESGQGVGEFDGFFGLSPDERRNGVQCVEQEMRL